MLENEGCPRLAGTAVDEALDRGIIVFFSQHRVYSSAMSSQVTRLTPEHGSAMLPLLAAVLEGNPETHHPAENELNRLSSLPGFCSLLIAIGRSREVPEPLRTLALIIAKTVIHTMWSTRQTPRGPVGIGEDEKVDIRRAALEIVEQESKQVAVQVALLIGKIARHDYPSHWPQLMPSLFHGVQDQNPLLRLRSLLCLHHVILALRSRTQLSGRMQFHDVAPDIFRFVSQLWTTSISRLFGVLNDVRTNPNLASQLEQFEAEAEQTKLDLKVIHGLLLGGFTDWSDANGVLPFLRSLIQQWQALIGLRNSLPDNKLSHYLVQYEKLFGKILVDTFKRLPNQWVPLLVPYLQFCLVQLKDFDANRKQVKFLVNLMLFVKLVITCKTFEKENDGLKIVTEFSSPALLQELSSLLITRYMVFSRDELEEWKNDPEAFTHEEDLDDWTGKRRAMAENLFGILLENYRLVLGPFVARIVQEVPASPSSLQEHLLKDAIYNAVALSPYDLYKFLPFDQWWKARLFHEVQTTGPFANIIHRRIMLIVASWVSNLTDEIRPSVYASVTTTMGSTDRAVALSAAYALSFLVKDMDFKPDDFERFLELSVGHMIHLTRTSVTSDMVLKLLDIFAHLVTEMKQKMRPYIMSVIQLSASLWEQSRDQHFIKGAVVKLLNDLIKVLGTEFDSQSILQPVLEHSLDVTAPDSVYLLEDGLSLWLSTLRSLSVMSENMMRVFPNLFRIVALSYEHFDVCMSVLETYILLGGAAFLRFFFPAIVEMMTKVIDDVREEGTVVATKPLEVLLLLFPQDSTAPLDVVFQKLLKLIGSNQESTRAYCAYCGVFCRLLLHNQAYFFSFFERMSSMVNSNLLATFLPFCLDKVEHMAELGRRKVVVMALLSIVANASVHQIPNAATYIANLVVAASSVIIDEEAGPGPEWIARPEAEITDDYELYLNDAHAVPVNVREWRLLFKRDPINTGPLRQYLEERMKELLGANKSLYEAAFKEVPEEVLRSLGIHN